MRRERRGGGTAPSFSIMFLRGWCFKVWTIFPDSGLRFEILFSKGKDCAGCPSKARSTVPVTSAFWIKFPATLIDKMHLYFKFPKLGISGVGNKDALSKRPEFSSRHQPTSGSSQPPVPLTLGEPLAFSGTSVHMCTIHILKNTTSAGLGGPCL